MASSKPGVNVVVPEVPEGLSFDMKFSVEAHHFEGLDADDRFVRAMMLIVRKMFSMRGTPLSDYDAEQIEQYIRIYGFDD